MTKEETDSVRLGVLCSGGKDSIVAWKRAMDREEVVCLITLLPANEESYMFHTPNVSLVALQARAAGLPLIEKQTAGVEGEELDDLRDAILLAKERHGIEGVVTGAILSVYQASRIQRICRQIGLWCFNPLWLTDQEAHLWYLVQGGYSVIVSGIFSEPFDESWLGRGIDAATIPLLLEFKEEYGITLTGEGGEYETLVLDAPFFGKRIEITAASREYCNHRGFFRIAGARLVEK